MPSARAFRVIILAKPSSVPPIYSAITTAASFAERVTSPLMASSTLMVWPARRSSLVGSWSAACSDTGISVSSLILPASRRSNSRYSVMILVSDAGWRMPSGLVAVSDCAGIAVDDDGGELRAVAAAVVVAGMRVMGGMTMAVVTASLGAVGRRDDRRGDSDQSKNANSHQARGRRFVTKHEFPVPVSDLITGS